MFGMFSVCLVWVGLTMQKRVVGHVRGAPVRVMRCQVRTNVGEECADHLKRVAAIAITSIPKREPAQMKSMEVMLLLGAMPPLGKRKDAHGH